MGGTSAHAPVERNGEYLAPYTQSLVNAALHYVAPTAPQFGQGGYTGLSATPPSYAQAANTASQMINALPMQTGRYLVAPTALQTPAPQPAPVNFAAMRPQDRERQTNQQSNR